MQRPRAVRFANPGPGVGSRYPSRRPLRFFFALAILAVLSASPGWTRHPEGQPIAVKGSVTDRQGFPIPGVNVILEGARKRFHLRRLGWQRDHPRPVSTVTNERGEYSLPWTWYSYFNHFELSVAITVRGPNGEQRQQVLKRVNLNDQIKRANPVRVDVTLEDTRYLDSVRQFIASVRSDDERRVYAEMGNPEKVDVVHYSDHSEVSWWYFGLGKAYRFNDGKLEEVITFPAVKPF